MLPGISNLPINQATPVVLGTGAPRPRTDIRKWGGRFQVCTTRGWQALQRVGRSIASQCVSRFVDAGTGTAQNGHAATDVRILDNAFSRIRPLGQANLGPGRSLARRNGDAAAIKSKTARRTWVSPQLAPAFLRVTLHLAHRVESHALARPGTVSGPKADHWHGAGMKPTFAGDSRSRRIRPDLVVKQLIDLACRNPSGDSCLVDRQSPLESMLGSVSTGQGCPAGCSSELPKGQSGALQTLDQPGSTPKCAQQVADPCNVSPHH